MKIVQFRKKIVSLKHIGLDSMCFIYQFAQHPTYSPLTNTLFTLMGSGRISASTSSITIAEVFVEPEKRQDRITIENYEKFFESLPNLKLFAVDWNAARFAAKLRAAYSSLKIPDALQLATSLLSGCNGFVTNDARLTRIKEIPVIYLSDFL